MRQARGSHGISATVKCLHRPGFGSEFHPIREPSTHAVPQLVRIGIWEIRDHAGEFEPLNSNSGLIKPPAKSAACGALCPFDKPASTTCTSRHFDWPAFFLRRPFGLVPSLAGGAHSTLCSAGVPAPD